MRLSEAQRQKILEAVGKGNHPHVACTAAGLNVDYFYRLRQRARANDLDAQEFLAAINAAQAQSEIDAVDAAHRATQPIEEAKIVCPHCGEAYVADVMTIAYLADRVHDHAKAKSLAADIALKKLERRHPKRWSQKVVHTIAEEHDRLLDVAQRVLEPEVFELLLEEYLAGGEGESETPGGPSGQAEGEVH